jgi:hypothetical protein
MMREIWLWEGKEKEEERGRQSVSDKAFLNTLEGLVFCGFSDSNSDRGYDIG